jgi:hypothetical protein
MSHSNTFLLPLIFSIIALILLISDRIKESEIRLRFSMFLFILNGLATTLTSGLGGSAIKKAKLLPGIRLETLSAHAWFGALAFLISLILLFLAVKILRKGKNNLLFYFLIINSILFAIFYGFSIYSSSLFFK